jgi:hypothetical protein
LNVHKNAWLTLCGQERILRQFESGRTPPSVTEATGVWASEKPKVSGEAAKVSGKIVPNYCPLLKKP